MTEAETNNMPNVEANEDNPDVYSNNVAIPEVRTGKVDVDGDFAEGQDKQNHKKEHHVSFDTVAVPEYHTGKCPPFAPGCKDAFTNKNADKQTDNGDNKDKHKHHNIFVDLARTLVNGSSDDEE